MRAAGQVIAASWVGCGWKGGGGGGRAGGRGGRGQRVCLCICHMPYAVTLIPVRAAAAQRQHPRNFRSRREARGRSAAAHTVTRLHILLLIRLPLHTQSHVYTSYHLYVCRCTSSSFYYVCRAAHHNHHRRHHTPCCLPHSTAACVSSPPQRSHLRSSARCKRQSVYSA